MMRIHWATYFSLVCSWAAMFCYVLAYTLQNELFGDVGIVFATAAIVLVFVGLVKFKPDA